mgnify:CR=1 FL=1|tara:strand:- start:2516 stop:3727 length:1212 start_codon:yes stop_codon:yes gene_type:complete
MRKTAIMIDFTQLASNPLTPKIEMPSGLSAEAKYIFSVTYTDPDAMQIKDFAKAIDTVIAREGLSLGPYPPALGHEGLRSFIADDLKKNRGIKILSENIFLSSGASGVTQTLVAAFVNPGDVILMDEYCYHGSLNTFMRNGAEPIHIQMDEEGMIADALENAIKQNIEHGIKPKFIYTIPVYHNPTGITFSLERRHQIVEISKRYEIPIIENESYADFRIDGPKLPPSMMSLAENEGVIYLSAFTKLLGCGLRVGFGVFPENARTPLENVFFGTGPSHLASMAIFEYLSQQKDEYVNGVVASLKTKRDAMLRALGEYFPPSCSWTEPNGGMMIWVELPGKANTWNALDRAVERGVKYNPGPIFRSDRGSTNKLRLTYSQNTTTEIEEGIAILADVFENEGLFS